MSKCLIAGVPKEIPLWMYFVRSLIDVLTGTVNLFLLPFRRQLNLNAMWQGKMLHSLRERSHKRWA